MTEKISPEEADGADLMKKLQASLPGKKDDVSNNVCKYHPDCVEAQIWTMRRTRWQSEQIRNIIKKFEESRHPFFLGNSRLERILKTSPFTILALAALIMSIAYAHKCGLSLFTLLGG